jgi:hypothetical protein
VVAGALLLAALIAYTLIGRPLRVAARRAFRPLGLRARRMGLTGIRGKAAVHGRTIEVRMSTSMDGKTSWLVIELASGSRFDVTFCPPNAKHPLVFPTGDELAVPGFPDYRVFSTDASRALALCRAAEGSLHRLLTPPSPAQARFILVRADVLKLVIANDAWPGTLAADVDEMIALAARAERV